MIYYRRPKVKAGPHAYGKLIENDKNFLYKCINHGYTYFMYAYTMTRRALWFGSCCGLIFLIPFALESMNEQAKILAKIENSKLDFVGGPSDGGMAGGGAMMRPF